MKIKTLFAALLVVCLFSFSLMAQGKKKLNEEANTRSVQGIVTSSGDQPVTGAVVQLKDTKTLQIRSYITHEDGKYHFAGLSTNVDYELKAEHAGANSGSKTLSIYDGRKEATINLKLK